MSLWTWLKGLFAHRRNIEAGRDRSVVALVLLLDEPVHLDALSLADHAGMAFGCDFHGTESDDLDNYVAGESPSFLLKHDRRLFLVNSFDHPYVDDPEAAAASIPELRLRKAMRDHQAWVSVDLLGEVESDDLGGVYRSIAKLLAELADGRTLAIFAPALGQLAVFNPEMIDGLRGPDPLSIFASPFNPPVVPVNGNDPRLREAVQRAQRAWPDFVEAFEQRRPEQSFSAKARIGSDEHFEFMWMTVTGLEHGWIYGRLDNEPFDLDTHQCGDRVRVSEKHLNDWLYTDGGSVIGGFTIDVLRQIQQETHPEG